MTDSLDIAAVARLTGLTSRALRFYEARGMVAPLRTSSGRRYYGPAELERLHRILIMKRAGLTLAQIQRVTAERSLDLRAIVEAQLEVLAEREREIATSRSLLESILSRIDRSEPIDVATFCSLIRNGETTMSEEKWAEIQRRYMTAEQRAAYERACAALPADFDHEAHHARFKDLDRRIVAALPLDPASPQAQAYLDEWDALTAPFVAVAPPAMLDGMMNLLGNIEEWADDADPGFSVEAYRFHQQAHRAREAMKQS